MRWLWSGLFLAPLLAVAVVLNLNCVSIAANLIAYAPNHDKHIDVSRPFDLDALRARGVSQAFRVDVGPPNASLAVWIVEPAGEPRGTVLYLHGMHDRKESLLATAISHAKRGYRGVLVDSRGHGESTGQWLTYGAREVRDYQQLLDELDRRGMLTSRLAVYGCSYGGGVGAQLAGRDSRVTTAVLLAPFASLDQVVHARTHSLGLSWLFSDKTIDAGIARACQWADVSAADADGVAALHRRAPPILVIHGRNDQTVPCKEGVALCEAAGPDSRLVLIDGATHQDWTDAGLKALWTESTAWFDRWLDGADR